VRGPSLRSGFRQQAPAELTPAKRLNSNMEMHHYDAPASQARLDGRGRPSLRDSCWFYRIFRPAAFANFA